MNFLGESLSLYDTFVVLTNTGRSSLSVHRQFASHSLSSKAKQNLNNHSPSSRWVLTIIAALNSISSDFINSVFVIIQEG